MTQYLSAAAVARVYNRIGALQDTQAFYEDPALEVILHYADFSHAERVYEAGCGTGRVAARLLREVLRPGASYIGADISDGMIALGRRRTAQWPNAQIARADITHFDPGVVDRVLSLFVVDLMDDVAIAQFLDRAHKSLTDGGLLCIAGLAEGDPGLTRWVSQTWKKIHTITPALLGGCRPKAITPHLDPERWRVVHVEHQSRYGISSDAVIAAKVARSA